MAHVSKKKKKSLIFTKETQAVYFLSHKNYVCVTQDNACITCTQTYCLIACICCEISLSTQDTQSHQTLFFKIVLIWKLEEDFH